MSDHALVVDGVSKFYGEFAAVDDVSFRVPKGCIYGLLGPNGAGKTTTLRMVNDILVPDTGRVTLLGDLAPGPQAAKRIGYLPEERGLYPKMRVGELLTFFGELRGVSRDEAGRRARTWLERLGITDWIDKRVRDLSKGMQQKVQFATTLLHEPELYILDEPWSGLDPINADVLRDVVLEQRDKGRTVIFSTHRMEQAEQICDEVCIMARGRKVLDGTLSDIKDDSVKEVVYRIGFDSPEVCGRAAKLLSVEPEPEPDAKELSVPMAGRDPQAILATLVEGEIPVAHFDRLEPTLHEIFVDRVGRLAGTEMKGRGAA